MQITPTYPLHSHSGRKRLMRVGIQYVFFNLWYFGGLKPLSGIRDGNSHLFSYFDMGRISCLVTLLVQQSHHAENRRANLSEIRCYRREKTRVDLYPYAT